MNLYQRGGEGGYLLCVSDTVAQCQMPYEAHWHWERFCQRLYKLHVWALVCVCCSLVLSGARWSTALKGQQGHRAVNVWCLENVESRHTVLGEAAKLSKERIQKLELNETT